MKHFDFFKNMREYVGECNFTKKESILFQIKLTIAHFLKMYCINCDSDGMSGYWERDVCCFCDGWHLFWDWSLREKTLSFLRHKNWDTVWFYEYEHNKANIIKGGFP